MTEKTLKPKFHNYRNIIPLEKKNVLLLVWASLLCQTALSTQPCHK